MRAGRSTVAALAAASLAWVAPAPARAAAPDVVSDWNAALVNALVEERTPPPASGRVGAIVQGAVFDAVNGVAPRYEPLHVLPDAPRGASAAAAVVWAAHDTLVALFGNRAGPLGTLRDASLAAIPDSQAAKDAGRVWGRSVAQQFLEWRRGDGFTPAPPPATGGTGPGVWRPTSDNPSPGALPQLGATLPFSRVDLDAAAFRLAGPPKLTLPRYAAEFAEVMSYGANGVAATNLTRDTALFWRPNSVVTWNQVAQQLVAGRGLSPVDTARFYGLVNVAMADATRAAWKEKYRIAFWRPITANEEAASDGNPTTQTVVGTGGSPWAAVFATPNHPDYPSGHATISGAATAALAALVGERTPFSVTVGGVERSYDSFSDASDQVDDSRVYAGIHFRSAVNDGQELGRAVTAAVLDTTMRRAR